MEELFKKWLIRVEFTIQDYYSCPLIDAETFNWLRQDYKYSAN